MEDLGVTALSQSGTGASGNTVTKSRINGSDSSSPFDGSNAFNQQVLESPLTMAEGSNSGTTALLRTVKRRLGLFLFTFAVVTGALAINTLRQRLLSPVYEGGFQMQISNPIEAEIEKRDQSKSNSIESVAKSNFNADLPSLIVLLRSPLLINAASEKLGVSAKEIQKNLSIAPIDESVKSVLNVRLRWADTTKGREILNEVSKEYIRFSVSQRQEAMASGVKFLDQQAPKIMSRMEKLQNEMMNFRKNNNGLDPADNSKNILGARELLITDLRALQKQQVELSSRLQSIQSGKLQWSPSGAPTAIDQLGRSGVLVPGRGAGAEVAKDTKTPIDQLNQLDTDLATARATYREESPIVQSILARRNTLVPVIQRQSSDAVRAELLANVAQQDEINRQILLLTQNLNSNPTKMKQFEELQQRLTVARDQYSSYITTRENFRLELSRSTTPWKLISPPEFADIPVEPNIKNSLLRALIFGLLAGLGIVVLRERTDNTYHTPKEAEQELQLPALGLVPYLPLEQGVDISLSLSKMSDTERFAVKESLRSLFTTFRLLRADSKIRMVGITSATPSEGKSTAVSVFGRTLADLDLKVLIVDADMRLPMQARYSGIEAGEGLSTLLSDSNVKATTLIKKVADNLDLMPSGPKPPDPGKLLNSQRCVEVANEIRAIPDYDIVIWDTPPCLMLTDAGLIAEKLDGILFLIGLDKVSKDVAPQAYRRLKASGVDVLGMICNQVGYPTRLNDYGFEYGYYYDYNYSKTYGPQPDKDKNTVEGPIADIANSKENFRAKTATKKVSSKLEWFKRLILR